MKILFVNNIHGFYGGIEQVILHTARGLQRRGHTSYIAYGVEGKNREEFDAFFEGAFQCSEFGTADPAGDTFAQIIDRVKPDVVFFHKLNQLPPRDDQEQWPRTVRMVHDTDLFCPTGLGYFRHGRKVCHYRAGWRCWFDLAFLARAASGPIPIKLNSIPKKIHEMRRSHHLDAILAVSTFVKDKLVTNGFPDPRVHLCHPILEIEVPEATTVPEEPRILFVGALLRGKGVDLLLRALKQVTVPFSATIVGIGKSEEKLKRLCAELGLDHCVQFKGWIHPTELSKLYRNTKIVAVPSRGPESFTLIGQESMRHGRPVVAFDVGGNSNWLDHEHTGYIVPEQDIAAYAHALERLLTDTALARQMGANAAVRVRERFSFDQYLDKLEGFLQKD